MAEGDISVRSVMTFDLGAGEVTVRNATVSAGRIYNVIAGDDYVLSDGGDNSLKFYNDNSAAWPSNIAESTFDFRVSRDGNLVFATADVLYDEGPPALVRVNLPGDRTRSAVIAHNYHYDLVAIDPQGIQTTLEHGTFQMIR